MSSLHFKNVESGTKWTRGFNQELNKPFEGKSSRYPQSIFFFSKLLPSPSCINCPGPIAHASMKIDYFISITPLMAV